MLIVGLLLRWKTDYNDSGEGGGDTDQDGSNASRDGETMKFR